jgi:dUTPase
MRPSEGNRGQRGILNFVDLGVFFLNLIAERFTVRCTERIAKLVIATVCLKSRAKANTAIRTPVKMMDTQVFKTLRILWQVA